MKFAGFLCFLCVYTLSLALPADPTSKDVQTQSPLVMENEDTRSVFPEEVDKYYWSKQATPQYGYIWRYKLVPILVDPRVSFIEYTLPEDQPSEINPQDLQEGSQENAEKSSVGKTMHRLKRQVSGGIGVSLSIPSGRGGVPSWSVEGHGRYQDPASGWGVTAGIRGELGKRPSWSVEGHGGYQHPSFGWGARAGIGGELGKLPSWSVEGHGGYQHPSFGLGARAGIGGELGQLPSWSVEGHGGYQHPSFGSGARAGIRGESGKPPVTSLGGYLSGNDIIGLTGVLGGGWHSQAGTTFGIGAGYRGLGGHIDHQNGRFSAGAGSMPNLDPSRNHDPLHGSHS